MGQRGLEKGMATIVKPPGNFHKQLVKRAILITNVKHVSRRLVNFSYSKSNALCYSGYFLFPHLLFFIFFKKMQN